MILDGSRRLAAGELEAVFLPEHGMLGASLRHRGVELLRRVGDLEAAAAKGSTAGIPLLHPWANRLEGPRYWAAGREVVLDMASPLVHADESGLPIHGVPWSRLAWGVVSRGPDRVTARLDWDRPDLLAVFPFRHRLEMDVVLSRDGLTIRTTLTATGDRLVPISFGFHPYVGVPGVARESWRLELPATRRLVLDERGIPTGREEPRPAFAGPLGDRSLDDGFALESERVEFVAAGGGRRIGVALLEGYRFAQVYAPAGSDFAAFEPMTAPTNALISGRGLRVAHAGESFRAAFRIRIETAPPESA
jgi:aldose 1-epimerase